MKLIRIHQYGEPDVMKLEDAPIPEPGAGQVRLKVEAAGVNFVDIYNRIGQYKMALPFTPGKEAAGVVDAVGEGVTEFRAGDRVASASLSSAYAENVLAAADKLVTVPEGVSTRDAAAVMLQGMTAHYLSTDTFALKPGDTALIHAAAGGTGTLLVQMAKLRGARVIGTVSTEQKMALVREAGADEVLLYDGFDDAVPRLTNGRGVDVVYDSVGKDTFDRSLNCLRPRGFLVLFGAASGPVPPFDPQTLRVKGSLFLTRPTSEHYLATREETLKRADDLFNWMAAGRLKVCIDSEFPLAEAASAHRALAGRGTHGKVLLLP